MKAHTPSPKEKSRGSASGLVEVNMRTSAWDETSVQIHYTNNDVGVQVSFVVK